MTKREWHTAPWPSGLARLANNTPDPRARSPKRYYLLRVKSRTKPFCAQQGGPPTKNGPLAFQIEGLTAACRPSISRWRERESCLSPSEVISRFRRFRQQTSKPDRTGSTGERKHRRLLVIAAVRRAAAVWCRAAVGYGRGVLIGRERGWRGRLGSEASLVDSEPGERERQVRKTE